MRYLRAPVVLLLLALWPMHEGRAAVDQANATAAVQGLLESAALQLPPAEGERLRSFYVSRAYAPAWWQGGRWSADAGTALQTLAGADRRGLVAADYHPQRLSAALDAAAGGDAATVATADLQLSAAVMAYLDDLINGRVDPLSVGWKIDHHPYPVEVLLGEALRTGRLDHWLAAAGPQTPAFRALLDLRARYRALEAAGPWPFLPEGPTLARGDEGEAVAILRRQLALLGDLPASPLPMVGARTKLRGDMARTDAAAQRPHAVPVAAGQAGPYDARTEAGPARFDLALESAVKRFQRRHGLTVDGHVGAGTRAALNVGPRARLRQIEANLERLRWMPADLGERHVVVNIPAFELTAVTDGHVALRMPVVVGEPDWPTPVLSDEIVDFKFAPTWTVPASILRREMLPQIRRDPGYLERKGLRVLYQGREVSPWEVDWSSVSAGSGYVLRQEPGPRNALGQIRFSLTNPYDIYLHDTPTTSSFARANRAVSHGCIRVAQPEELALFLLDGNPAWDRARLRQAMNARGTHFHTLDRPVPVYLAYFTAWVDGDGVAQFRNDVYGRDAALIAALEHRPGRAPPAI